MPSLVVNNEREELKRRIAGTAYFYQFHDASRTPLFLHRNLKKVLEYHRARSKRLAGPSNAMNPAPSRLTQPRIWDPKEIIQLIDKREWTDRNPHLRIDVKGLTDRRKTFKLPTSEQTHDRHSKRVRHEGTNAICCLTIWEGSGPEILVQDQVFCRITSQSDTVTGERRAKIDLEQAFVVLPEQLAPKGKQGVTAIRYSMQLTLQALDKNEKWPPVDLSSIPAPKTKHVMTDAGLEIFPMLVVSYTRLPCVPTKEDEASLLVTALQDYKQLQVKLGLQVDMNWIEAATPLEYSNHIEMQKHKARLPAVIKPKQQMSAETAHNLPIETVWDLREDSLGVEECVFSGYVCPLCNNRKFDGSDIYWFHLMQSHDLFKFRVTTRFPQGDDEAGVIRVSVRLNLKDPIENRKDKNSRNFETIKQKGLKMGPDEVEVLKTCNTFFDLEQYLKDDEQTHWGRKPDKRRADAKRHDSNVDSPRANSVVPDLTRPAHLVPDLPPCRRKKFPVPEAPDGVTFFSSRVKRPLQTHEMRSESDDEIDDEWFLQKHADRIDSFKDLTPEERRFLKRHDIHVLREGVTSNLHYCESLVRFCRLNRKWLRRQDMRVEFTKKCTALLLEGRIKAQQMLEYFGIIDSEVQETGPSDAASENEEDSEPRPPNDFGILYAFCHGCDKAIRSSSNILRCNNPICTNDYHKTCLGTMKPETDEVSRTWRCPECDPVGPRSSKDHRSGGGGDAMDVDKTEDSSPELAILNKFAPDHLSLLPSGHRLDPGDQPAQYPQQDAAVRPTFDGPDPTQAVRDSEDADSDFVPEIEADSADRNSIHRQSSGGLDAASFVERDTGKNAEYPKQAYLGSPNRVRYVDPMERERERRRMEREEIDRRIRDDNQMDWLERRKIREEGAPRPRRPHEL